MALTVGESSSQSPCSSSSTPRLCTYHVFLSFRGEDTRKGFTDHLYAALERKGITTFKDDKDLERGQVISKELLKAIEESMFAITILSPNYASSTWCLDELQKIMECNSKLDLEVLPVFYGVDPSDVRHQKRRYEEAFRKHQEIDQHSDRVERWRGALTQVASYSGWDSKDQHEAVLVESIAQHIHKKLVPKLPSCTENLVAIASKVEEVTKLIGMGLNDVRFIGIWGMGGIGKTTIARAFYETIQGQFEVVCFLANVREVSETNGLVHIQRELLSHMSISRSDFYNLYDGKNIIRNSLCRKKVLLVLDDVNDEKQLENLAGKQDWFGPGSRVIITTRDMHLLMAHEVHQTYEVGRLFQYESLHLFCLKAFKGDQPQEGYLDLSKEVVEYTGGLPLALEVLGSYLYGRNVDVWHNAVKKLRSVPHPKIQDKLKISYESLDSMEKNIFLDIACFFKGMKRDKVIDILENCGYFPKIGIEILIEKSLITIDRVNNKLGMHDLLLEMGRNIVFQESPNDPSRRSRLWSQVDIDHVLTKNKGTEAINSISLNLLQPYEAQWSTEAFSKTSQLKFLRLCEMQLPLGLSCLPCSLKVLHWKGCPLKTLPLKNRLDEVFDIKLSHSKIEQLWQGIKFMEKLKYLKLTFSKNLKQLPDFSEVPNLEILILKGCASLTEVHPSLVHHKKVVLLKLEGCKSLESLPGKLEMSSLKELILSGCSEFKFLPEFGESMKHLSVLSLEGTAVRKLPSSLGCLVGLAVLNLKGCKSLVCLPDTIHGLNSLKILNISGCSELCRLPDVFKEIKCLEELHANDTAVDEIPSSILYLDNLKVLSFAGCKGSLTNKSTNWFLRFNCMSGSQPAPTGLRFPPCVWSIPSLRDINLSYCNLSEESVPDNFFHLPALEYLDLTGNNFVSIPSNISKLSRLKFLTLNRCQKLQLLPELPSSIIQLDACNCDSLGANKFNPAKPRVFLFFSQAYKCIMEKRYRPMARFDMLIPGNKIPSWFGNDLTCLSRGMKSHLGLGMQRAHLGLAMQRDVSRRRRLGSLGINRHFRTRVPINCPLDESAVGFALCFLLVSYDVPPDQIGDESCKHQIDCYLGKQLISTRRLPLVDPSYPHLYILYLSVDQIRDKIPEDDDYWSKTVITLGCLCGPSLRVVTCGTRLVRKQDVEDWNKVMSQLNKS